MHAPTVSAPAPACVDVIFKHDASRHATSRSMHADSTRWRYQSKKSHRAQRNGKKGMLGNVPSFVDVVSKVVPVIATGPRNVRTSAYSGRGSLLPNRDETDGVRRPHQGPQFNQKRSGWIINIAGRTVGQLVPQHYGGTTVPVERARVVGPCVRKCRTCDRDVAPRLACIFRRTHYNGTVGSHVRFAASRTTFSKGEEGAARKCKEVWDSVACATAFSPRVPVMNVVQRRAHVSIALSCGTE